MSDPGDSDVYAAIHVPTLDEQARMATWADGNVRASNRRSALVMAAVVAVACIVGWVLR